MYPHP